MFPSSTYFRTENQFLENEQGYSKERKKFTNYDNLTKEDALTVFKELLSDMGVGTTWKWEDVNRII